MPNRSKYMSRERKNYNGRLRPSPRQLQILKMMADGTNRKQIAIELGLSVRTVDLHLYCLRERLQATTNEQAVYTACILGILETDPVKIRLEALRKIEEKINSGL